MLYLKASMDEIENPTEREMVYVIDRNADDEFFEDPYDPYQETVVVENRDTGDEEGYEKWHLHDCVLSGTALMNGGITFPIPWLDYQSMQYYIKEIEG